MQFPITDLLNEKACSEALLDISNDGVLKCPQGHPLPLDQRPPVLGIVGRISGHCPYERKLLDYRKIQSILRPLYLPMSWNFH